MRGRIVRVRRRHARSMQWALALLLLSLALYLFSAMGRVFGPKVENEPASTATEAVPVAEWSAPAPEQVTREVRFDGLSAHLIDLGQFDSAETARIEAARYVRRGAAGYIMQDGDNFRVIGALYAKVEDAKAVALRLTDSEQIAASVITAECPRVAMRVTASELQITALTDGEASLRNLTDQLIKLGLDIDNGRFSMESAVQQIQLVHAEAQLRLRALERALGEDEHPVMRSLMLQLQSLADATGDGLSGANESMLSFSAKIKYNSINMRLRQIEFLRGLAA